MKLAIAIVALFLGATTGCGSKARPIGTAKGKITYKSEPVEQGNVVFENRSIGCFRTGSLSAGGQYEVNDLALGEYKVSIQPPEPDLPNENDLANGGRIRITPGAIPDPKNIPKPFRATESTPLVVSVVEGDNQFSFDLAESVR